ncbi:unnamed protein product [Prunus brigantina]
MEWLVYCIVLAPLDFTQNSPNDYSHHIIMFQKFRDQSDIDWSKKLDHSCSYEVHSKMEWLVYCIFYRLDFTQSPPNYSSHHIMMFPKFCRQSDIDMSRKLDNSCSYEIRSELEWLVYCKVLENGFHSKPSK